MTEFTFFFCNWMVSCSIVLCRTIKMGLTHTHLNVEGNDFWVTHKEVKAKVVKVNTVWGKTVDVRKDELWYAESQNVATRGQVAGKSSLLRCSWIVYCHRISGLMKFQVGRAAVISWQARIYHEMGKKEHLIHHHVAHLL